MCSIMDSDCKLQNFDDTTSCNSHELPGPEPSTTLSPKNESCLVKVETLDNETQNKTCYPDLNAPVLAKSSDRDARNKAEKQRRNKLNAYIGELSSLLPAVVQSPRKIDKTGILRLAANDLRKEHVFGNSIKCCHLDLKQNAMLTLLDSMGGFLITVTCKGIITLLSSNVQSYLGHCQVDLLGQNLYNLVHPEDRYILENHLYPQELRNGPISSELFQRKVEFSIRIMRSSPRSEPARYELCRLDGSLRKADRAVSCVVSKDQVIRRQRVRRDRTTSSSGNDVVFVGMVKVIAKIRMDPLLLVSFYQEYWTRHLADGRIVQCDQRISLVAGYLTDEITGVSGFSFMHRDDMRWVVIALRQMYDTNRKFGESCYRLLSRTGEFIYLRTRGYLEIDEATKVVQSFVCVNSLVSEEEGYACIEEMKRKYSAIVDMVDNSVLKSEPDTEPIEDPRQLEEVIMHLVTNISTVEEYRNSKSLIVLPPAHSEIKSAIDKSVTVIKKTNLQLISFKSGKKRPSCESSDGENCKRRICSEDD